MTWVSNGCFVLLYIHVYIWCHSTLYQWWSNSFKWMNQCWLIVSWTHWNTFSEIYSKFPHFHSTKCIWNCRLRINSFGPRAQGPMPLKIAWCPCAILFEVPMDHQIFRICNVFLRYLPKFAWGPWKFTWWGLQALNKKSTESQCIYKMSAILSQPQCVMLTLNVRGPSYLGLTRSIQDISSPDIDFIGYTYPSLTWGRILSTCVKSMWRNDIKYKYMFMFPLKNLACKGLTLCCTK